MNTEFNSQEIFGVYAAEVGSYLPRRKRKDIQLEILSLLEAGLADTLKPGGTVIASGIIDDQEAEVRAALSARGIEVVARQALRDWVVLVGRREA